jgi:hypothetical protein
LHFRDAAAKDELRATLGSDAPVDYTGEAPKNSGDIIAL